MFATMKKILRKNQSLLEFFLLLFVLLSAAGMVLSWVASGEDPVIWPIATSTTDPQFWGQFWGVCFIVLGASYSGIKSNRKSSHIKDVNTNFTSLEERLSKIEKQLEDK